MWTLVLMLYFIDASHASGLGGGLASTTIDNFTSKVACEAAGKAFVDNIDIYQRNDVRTAGFFERTFFERTKSVDRYRFYANNISKAYQCVEVK